MIKDRETERETLVLNTDDPCTVHTAQPRACGAGVSSLLLGVDLKL